MVEKGTAVVVGIRSFRTRLLSMMTATMETSTTNKQPLCVTMDTAVVITAEMNTEKSIGMIAWWMMPLDGLAIR